MNLRSRALPLAILAVLALAASLILSASPVHAASKKVQVWTHGIGLNVRATPSASAKVVGTLKDKSYVTITCYSTGTAVYGYDGKTTVWDKLSTGGYVSDAWLITGSAKSVVPACPKAQPTKVQPKAADPGFRLPFPKGASYKITQGPKEHAKGPSPAYNKHAVDFAMQSGSKVSASNSGKVRLAQYVSSGGGKMILIDHGKNRCSQYAHLSSISVKKGQSVKRGQNIGKSGQTGLATGPHLHWNIVECSTQKSKEIVNTKELGKTYTAGTKAKSQNS